MRIGERVEIPAHLDAWMMGDRFGVVEKVGTRYHHVRMDRTGKLRRILSLDMEYGARSV